MKGLKGFKNWGSSEAKKHPAEPLLSKAIHAPGIPVMIEAQPETGIKGLFKVVRWAWVIPWFFAMIILGGSINMYGKAFHRTIWIELPADADISIYAKGCDINVEPNKYSTSRMRVNYWTQLGSGSAIVNGTKVEVRAISSMRSTTWRCVVNLYPNHKGHLIDKLSIKVDPSDEAQFNVGPSNVEEVIEIKLDGSIIKTELNLDVKTFSDVSIIGVQVPQMTASIVGGLFSVHEAIGGTPEYPEWLEEKFQKILHLPKSMNLNLQSATVVVNTHNADMKVKVAQDTVDDAILSAATVTNLGNDLYELARSSKGEKGPYVSVTLEANDCAIYFTATDNAHYFGDQGANGLDVHRGSSTQKGPRLLPVGVSAMKELSEHLNKTGLTTKFMVYFDISAPHAPAGTLRLLSTESYLAFSTWFFVLMSAGMLNPEVIRITTPLVGLDFLFPRTLNEGALSKPEQEQFVKGLFQAVSEHVDIFKLGKPFATWVWDPIGPEAFLFKYHPGKHHKPGSWVYRAVTSGDTYPFHLCAGITATLGLMLGLAVSILIVFHLKPYILTLSRNKDVEASATYQLKYQVLPYDWNTCPTFVSFPLRGILLRWGKRPKQPQFVALKISARHWPVYKHIPTITTDCDPTLLPSPPGAPDQQAFLFPVVPRNPSEKNKPGKEPPAMNYNQLLAATARTVYSEAELAVGRAFAFRIQAFDNVGLTGNAIDTSNWTRPVAIKASMVCTEYPLLLWKTLCCIVPSDPFQYFLDKHCCPIKKVPSMVVTLSKMQLAIMNDSVLLAGGATTYGEHIGEDNASIATALQTLGSDDEKIRLVASTGGDEQTVQDTIFEATDRVGLPGMYAKKRTDNLKTFEEVTGLAKPSDIAEPDLAAMSKTNQTQPKHKYLVIDFDKEAGTPQKMPIITGQDNEQIIRLEAVKGDDSTGDDFSHTARFQITWDDLLHKLVKHGEPIGNAGETIYHVIDWMTMRDGLSPVAFLMVDITLTNSVLNQSLPKATAKSSFPQIFTSVLPGSTHLWGQDLMIHWGTRSSAENQTFNIQINVQNLEHLSSKPTLGDVITALALADVNIADGHAHLRLAPFLTSESYSFKCTFTATAVDDAANILATSPTFVVIKPMLLQTLEMGYATFCVRNRMGMIPFGNIDTLSINNGLDVVERTFSVVSHYRLPLPIQGTGEPEAYAYKDYKIGEDGTPLVENGGSYVVVGDKPMKVRHQDLYEVVESTSKELDSEVGSEEMEQVEKLPVSTAMTLHIPTNLFWKAKSDSDWNSELLLEWGCLPTFAREGWMLSFLTQHGYPSLGKRLNWVDNIFRLFLEMFLWWLQMIVLLSPVWLLMCVWMWHDNLCAEFNPNMGHGTSPGSGTSLFAFLVNPSLYKWGKLQNSAQAVYLVGAIYSIIVILLIIYGNFVHHTLPMSGFWVPLNYFVSITYVFTLFALVFYASLATCWILMGALVNPEQLMPYAMMVVGVMIVIKTNWTNLQSMKQHAFDGLASKLDIVTRAIMTIFIGKAGAAAAGAAVAQSQAELSDYAEKTCAYLKSVEKTAKQLYWQGSIELKVDALERDATLLLRKSPGFKAGIAEDVAKNKVYATDFVLQSYWDDAQGRANASHLIDNTRKKPLQYLVDGKPSFPDELIDTYDLHEAMAIDSLKGVDATSSDADEVQILAKKLGLRPKTAEMVHQAFAVANSTAAATLTGVDQVVNSPLSIGPIMANIREEQLFKQFLHSGITEDDLKFEDEAALVKEKGAHIGLSIVHNYIKEMNKKELLNLNAVVASNLTAMVDWVAISRKAAKFAVETLPNILVVQKIENQLNERVNGSAAFRVKEMAAEKVYTSKFEEVYCKNPNQFFVDCGIVEESVAKQDQCKTVLTGAVANVRAFDGSLDQAGLLKALDWLVLPSSRTTNEGPGGMINKMYLWKDALVRLLKDLGWNDDELQEDWLNAAWMSATNKKGVFEYEDIQEISQLICGTLAQGGMWKAAVKSFCFEIKIGGFLGVDVQKEGLEKASELAHAIELGDNTDLTFVNEKVRWPDWVKDIWNTMAEKSAVKPASGSDKRPSFLPLTLIDDFVEGLVYQSVDSKTAEKVTKTQMNKYPTNILDLQWYVGDDHGIWQSTADGYKRIRQIWMELYMSVADNMDCLPTDLDMFLKNFKWQLDQDPAKTPTLKFRSMYTWLSTEFIGNQNTPGSFSLTFSQFSVLLNDYMDFKVPDAVLQAEVFNPCPLVPGDDKCELRMVHDLGAALRIWVGYGMWKGGVREVIKQVCPRNATQAMALKLLPDEFDKLDVDGKGILQPGQTKLLLNKLMHPGLTLPEVTVVIQQDLGLNIPEREVHKFFCMIDVNGDGVLQATEFVSFIRVIMTNFYPQEILNYLGFSTAAVLKVIVTLLMCLIGLFIATTLVIKCFSSGPVAATIHSSISAGSSYAMKLQGDSSTGAGQAMSEITLRVDALVMIAITGLLGLAPNVVDELKQLFAKLL